MIQDFSAACSEAKKKVEQHPLNVIYWEAYIEALASQLPFQGDEKKIFEAWREYLAAFSVSLPDVLSEEKKRKERLLECIAWGILNKGVHSCSPLIRAYTMLGAFFGEDARGVKILKRGLSDPDVLVRVVSLQLASHLRDHSLQQEVISLFQKEKTPHVRLEAIKAIGKMEIPGGEEMLLRLLKEKGVRREEKEVAILALVSLLESVEPSKSSFLGASFIQQFQTSSNLFFSASMRELIPYIFLETGEKVNWEDLLPLLEDSCFDVRQSALRAVGLKRLTSSGKTDWIAKIGRLTQDPHPFVAITAAWALTLHHSHLGCAAFSQWLNHSNRYYQRLAAAALVATGQYGKDYLEEAFGQAQDLYVKMNLALGLLGQGFLIDEACFVLYKGLTENRERWMWQEKGGFRVLVPNDLRSSSAIPEEFEGTNRMVRLEILNLLAIMEYPKALFAVRDFLQKTEWGIGGIASLLLLQEGDENAVSLVESLLGDSQSKVRMQAALVLALWGKGEEAVLVLQEGYEKADRAMKEKILEAIGKTGDQRSIPFLIERLQEGELSLRLVGAAALLQCLYH